METFWNETVGMGAESVLLIGDRGNGSGVGAFELEM